MKTLCRRLICVLAGTPMLSILGVQIAFANDPGHADISTPPAAVTWPTDGTRAAVAGGLPRFFGTAEGRYVDMRARHGATDAQVLSQFESVFEGVPVPEVMFPDGFRMLISTMPKDASQMAMVVTPGTSRQIVAAALVHNFCGKFNDAQPGARLASEISCEPQPRLTIFYSGAMTSNPELNREMIAWVKGALAARNATATKRGVPTKMRVQVRTLDGA